MKQSLEVSSVFQAGTLAGSGGTITGTGTDWGPTYMPECKMVVALGATPSGTLVATLQQSAALSTGYTDVGTINTVGSTGGTLTYEYNAGALTGRYLRVVSTATGGTVLYTAALIGRKYVTS